MTEGSSAAEPEKNSAPRSIFSPVPAGQHVNLFVLDASDGNIRQLTYGTSVDRRPSVSPDGTTVVFISDRQGLQGLWTVPTDGSGAPRLLFADDKAYRPWYAADGGSVFFMGVEGERQRMYRIPATGGVPQPLPNDDRGLSRGAFVDPDGRSLLVHSTRGGEFGIWQLPVDGGEPRQLIPPGFEQIPHYHPTRADNGTLAFDARVPA